MRSFAATASIRATPERIWWRRIALHVTLNPGRAFPVNVATFDPPRRMVWRGGMPLGLFVGERVFTLMPKPDGAVEFSMRETFTGLLAPLIGRTLPDMQPAFDEFAAALKREAERP